MPEMTRYEHGVPSWVDIGTKDLSAGVRFFSELFGWEARTWARKLATTRLSRRTASR